MPARHPIACCLDVPESFRSKAAYALETLLSPLGLVPAWVSRGDVGDGVYYGPVEQSPRRALALRFEPATAAYFEARTPYDHRELAWAAWGGDTWPVLFPGTTDKGDLVASSFYWLSGWQEAVTTERDVHGRFPYRASLQARLGCLDQPLVDVYRELLAARLGAHGVSIERTTWDGRSWAVVPTHDIDLLRKRRLGTLGRAVGRRDGQRRVAVRQALLAPNPRRASVERIAAFERSCGAGATFFFKTAARGRWDVPYAHDGGWLSRTVRTLGEDGFEIGLHPSYFAYDHLGHLVEERDRLTRLTQSPITSVRQHFLRFDAVTPRLHQAAGFRLDSTLGFSEREGFRRATCFPFRLYDLAADAPTELWEMPLVVMDTTLFMHRGLNAPEANRVVEHLFRACRRVGGCCVMLWHNTVYDEVDYPGQGAVFEQTLDDALRDGAAALSLRDALATYSEGA